MTPIAPSQWLGVLGGGQLGRMFVHAAQARGSRVMVLEPDPHSPAAAAADRHLCAPYDDPQALAELARQCAAITTEFENVPADALALLERSRPVSPGSAAVRVCQHRALEKALFQRAGVPCAPHRLLEREEQLEPAQAAGWQPLLPGILKTAQLGYDGKGQRTVHTLQDLAAAWQDLGGVPCLLERRLPLAAEISVIVARGADGQVVPLPVQQNLHRGGILAVTQVPPPAVSPALCARAQDQAVGLARALDYVGVLCVEFFVLEDGSLVANEMAPRPHNSGHYSLDACDVSQFELQWRTLARWPLVTPRQHSAAVMLNLLGDLWGAAAADGGGLQEPPWAQVLALPGSHLHLYGKHAPRPGRKMGHLTLTAATAGQAREQALRACAVLGLAAF